ncbi:MAG: phosphoesterase PA-phosphatase related protein [Chloroflexota bacterium]|nr:phosphoesterase PA-phosphatase related protein [Chloroflexota bacterium]
MLAGVQLTKRPTGVLPRGVPSGGLPRGVPTGLPTLPPPPDAVVSPRLAVRRGRTARFASWLALAGFGAIFGLVRARRSDAVDLAVTLKLQQRDHPTLQTVMRAVSWPGFPPQSRIIPALIAVGLLLARLPIEAVFMLGAWGTALVASAVKAVMRRPRPVAGVDLRVVTAPLGGSSFPSGHTITYVGVYGFLAYLVATLLRPTTWRAIAIAPLLAVIAFVGPSRIHQGHHWFTDVTASYLLGIAYLIGLTGLYRRIKAGRAGVRP